MSAFATFELIFSAAMAVSVVLFAIPMLYGLRLMTRHSGKQGANLPRFFMIFGFAGLLMSVAWAAGGAAILRLGIPIVTPMGVFLMVGAALFLTASVRCFQFAGKARSEYSASRPR
jgi:hypothetical protein